MHSGGLHMKLDHRTNVNKPCSRSAAPKAVIAGKTVKRVAAWSAIEAIAPGGPDENIVAAVPIEDAHEFAASLGELREIQGIGYALNHGVVHAIRQDAVGSDEADNVVAGQASQLDLLDEQLAVAVQQIDEVGIRGSVAFVIIDA